MNIKAQHRSEFHLALFSLVCANLVWILPSTAICALALTVVPSREQLPLGARLAWFAVVCTVLIIRALVLRRWLIEPVTSANLQNRLNTATALTGATACCLGVYGFFALSLEYPLVSLLVVMMFSGMVACATAAISFLLPMYLIFIVPVMLPVGIRMVSIGGSSSIWIGGLILLFVVANIWMSRNIKAFILRSIELRFENNELLEDLQQEHQRAEVALAREEKANHAKSRFLAAASHDLRQPLHSLRLFTATLEMQTRNTEHKTLVKQIDSSVKSLEELFNALLDISKLDAGTINVDKKHVYLDGLLAQIIGEFKPLAEQKNLALSAQLDGLVVHTDIPLLETLLRNLVSNAIRYTEQGSVSITTSNEGGRISIAVSDTGVGIDTADQAKIFEEFVQLGNTERDRNQGIGLGLSIVKRLADLLDIELHLQSSAGNGTRFLVDVPQGDEFLCGSSVIPLSQPTDLFASLFVLVIDDEEEACLAIEGLLETWGCIVMCASSGEAAMQQLSEIGDVPDLVISDYRLRNGETGGDVVGRLRAELGVQLPAIIITGDIAPERLLDIKALELPLLHKPCEPEALRQLIASETSCVDEAVLSYG